MFSAPQDVSQALARQQYISSDEIATVVFLAAQLGKAIVMSKDPQRSAAFKVLKQPHAPSVLIELGYMSNSKDQAEMLTDAWQGKVADAVARSVESYFSKRTAVHP